MKVKRHSQLQMRNLKIVGLDNLNWLAKVIDRNGWKLLNNHSPAPVRPPCHSLQRTVPQFSSPFVQRNTTSSTLKYPIKPCLLIEFGLSGSVGVEMSAADSRQASPTHNSKSLKFDTKTAG